MKRTIHFSTLVLAIACNASLVHAETTDFKLQLRGELFMSQPVDSENSDAFGTGMGGAAGVELLFHPLIGGDIDLVGVWFSEDQSSDHTTWYGMRVGPQFHWSPLLGLKKNDGWVDAHYNFGSSGSIERGGFDIGVGFEFALNQQIFLGPFVRYQFGSDPADNDAHLLYVGAAASLFGREQAKKAPEDRDHDGVIDAEDLCPLLPAGLQPDPNRPGCPALDQDGDGVIDADDACPTEVEGANPDPDKPGCPLRDQDGDGVADAKDQCPVQSAGANPDPKRPGCPAVDSDEDGVFDHDDQCPNTRAGINPDPDKPGCPLPDQDGDAVPDQDDACPTEAGMPSTDPKKNGCPGRLHIEKAQIRIHEKVHFTPGKDVIESRSHALLHDIADTLRKLPIKHIRIEGHADSSGDDEFNLELSKKRANAVHDWLIIAGIEAERLEAVGYGESRPLADNNTKKGRAENRRVEFHILDEEYQEQNPTAPPAP